MAIEYLEKVTHQNVEEVHRLSSQPLYFSIKLLQENDYILDNWKN